MFMGAIRPENWMIQYESIGKNDVSWEMVIVGPNPPDYILPDNYRYIQADVKPVQCHEAAFRLTKGEFAMLYCDDVLFLTSHPLDLLYETFQNPSDGLGNDKLFVSCRFSIDWGTTEEHAKAHFLDAEGRCTENPFCVQIDGRWLEDCSRHPQFPCHHFWVANQESPILAFACLHKRQLHVDLGGYDSRFISGYYDSDIHLRVQEMGGRIIFSEVQAAETVFLIRDMPSVGGAYGVHDRLELLDPIWAINKVGPTPNFHRAMPIIPFKDEGILTETQGPKGRWN